MIVSNEERTPVDLYLEQQQALTPVARFSEKHQQNRIPEQEEYYRDLIPLSKPKPGEQYAFEVDLDKCTGCKACVTACHSLNGLETGETWRDVGLIHGGDNEHPFQQTVTTACHHCVDPGCLNGCPVLAYEKDEATGIVVHLDDQCIGCQYCVLKCPYDVPKYSERLGIVRKCDMCHDRLADGEAPACVQACPTEAIRITLVDQEEMTARKEEDTFLQGAPAPGYTKPTTQYVSQKTLPNNLEAADKYELKVQEPHWPLVLMLTLTQMAVGAVTFAWIGSFGFISDLSVAASLLIGMFALKVGMAASVTHLGQPLKAWRAFLGLRQSWLSREIVVFGAFFPAALAYTVYQCLPLFSKQLGEWATFSFLPSFTGGALGSMAVVSGLLGVFCSVMIYHDTQRALWRLPLSAAKFFGTAAVLGLGAMALGTSIASFVEQANYPTILIGLTLITLVGKLFFEFLFLNHHKDDVFSDDLQSAAIMVGPLRKALHLRFATSIVGAIFMVLALLFHGPGFIFLGMALAALVAGEISERYLYFRAVVAPKMPGII